MDYYKKGIVRKPVPAVKVLDEFIEAGLSKAWTYYFCGSWEDVPNRFFTMPLGRVRIIGIIAYVYDLEGFLHWGYNFWFSDDSRFPINPFVTTDADCAFPSGDAFLVYPGANGPLDSIRHEALADGMQDYQLLQLLEQKLGREKVLELIHEDLEYTISIKRYPYHIEWFEDFTRKIIESIKLN